MVNQGNIGINLGCSVLCAAVFWLISVFLLRSQLRIMSEKDENAEKGCPNPSKTFYLVMALGHIVSAAFMRCYYRTGWVQICNTQLILAVLWACAWIDSKLFQIPNRILLIGAAARCFLIAVQCMLEPELWRYTLLSSVVATAALLIVCILCRVISPGAIGYGDIKLFMLIGFVLQNDGAWSAVLLAMAASFFYSLYLVLFRHANRKTEIPFAPLILIGTLAASILMTI